MVTNLSMTVTGELWAAFLCLMAYLVMLLYRSRTKKDQCVRQMLCVCALLLLSDAVAWSFDGKDGSMVRAVVYAGNYLLYLSSYLIIFQYTWYMWQMLRRDNERVPVLLKAFWAGTAVSALVLTVGMFFNLYFYVDELNVYHRTDAYLFSQAITILGVAAMIWAIVKYRDRLSGYETIAACSCLILPTLGTAFQAFHYGVAYQMFGFAAATLITFFTREADVRSKLQETMSLELKARQELQEKLAINAALGTAYFCLYYIDLATGEYLEIEDPSLGVVSKAIEHKGKASDAFLSMSRNLVVPEQADEVLQFTDLATVPQRLQHQDTIGIHFLGPHVGWCEGVFISAKRNEQGNCTHALWGVRSIQQEKAKEEQYKQKLEAAKEAAEKHSEELDEQMDIIGSLASTYASIYYVDMQHLSFSELGNSFEHIEKVIGAEGDAVQAMDRMCRYIVVPEQADGMREFSDFSTLNERLRNKVWIGRQFQTQSGKWNEGIFIAARRDDQGNCLNVVWAIREINEMKRRELEYQRELEEARDRADAASAAKSSFLFNMSHDIRTPMNAIIGYTDLIEKHYDDKERCMDYLHKTQQSNRFLLSLINDVLEMARIESGKTQLDEAVTRVDEIARELSAIFADQMKQKGITFVSEVDTHTEWAFCDQAKVREIYLNILSNALKYTHSGGTVTMQVKEIPWDKPGYIGMRAVFADTGIGMSEEFLPHLFEAFTREYSATESHQQGTGLGMPIVKKIVELMGGTIDVTSQLGKGTTFTVTYPLKTEGAVPAVQKETQTAEAVDFSGKRILLAEDNELNAEIATEILSEAGFVVEHAEDGLVCVDMLQKAEAGYYDLILMDIQMPNLDGYGAARRIRALDDPQRAGIPIIAMTANAFAEDRQNALAAGMNGHLAKPIDIPKLIETLAAVLKG